MIPINNYNKGTVNMPTLVPVIPIDSPTSAALSAGASLVPSPVTPTTSPALFWSFHSSL